MELESLLFTVSVSQVPAYVNLTGGFLFMSCLVGAVQILLRPLHPCDSHANCVSSNILRAEFARGITHESD